MLEAYCGRRSYSPGGTLELKVSTDAPAYDLAIVRHARAPVEMLRMEAITGVSHPIPDDVVENGCGWPVALTIDIGADWPSGFYLVRLSSADEMTETFFVLRAAKAVSKILWVIETNTWNAYNYFGGASTDPTGGDVYAGGAPRVSFQRPLPRGFLSLPDSEHRLATVGVVDKDVPYFIWAETQGLTGWTGAASWAHWGCRFSDWLEDQSIEVDLAVNSDLVDFPELLADYRLVVSVGHDEYWSWEMRDAIEGFVARGGNVAFFSGNVAYWQVRLENGGEQMVAFKTNVEGDPVIGTDDERRNTGMWSNWRTRRPENQMTGLSFTRGGYARFAGATPASSGGYSIYRHRHWALAGTALAYGDLLGGSSSLVGFECDGCLFQMEYGLPRPTGEDGTPANFEIIAMAPVTLWSRETAPEGLFPDGELPDVELVAEQVAGAHDAQTVEKFVHGHAMMGSYTSPAGGTVFSAGTTDWAYALRDSQVSRITRNVLEKLSF
jgi:hypothetical protein